MISRRALQFYCGFFADVLTFALIFAAAWFVFILL